MEEFNSADILKNQNRKKKLAFLEAGLFEISFVLIVIVVFFGVLNYFNILSLSTLYPNQLGFLPHQKILNHSRNQLVHTPTQTPVVNSYTPINQISAVDIGKYSAYSKNEFAKPYYNTDAKSFIAGGILSGYNDNFVTLITATGAIEFSLTKDTTFSKYVSSVNKTNTAIVETIKKEEFLTKENIGKDVQVYYSKSDTNQAKDIYLL